MYQKARRGEIKNFTGIDDPYEPPVQPELVIDTVEKTAEDNARSIISYLAEKGFVK
jgi:sulfate adenylyltransferase